MAKYDVTYVCGHETVVNLGGKQEERDRKLDWLRSILCPECLERKKQDERAAEREAAAQEAFERGFPDLSGTVKQASFGALCRQEVMRKVEKIYRNLKKNLDSGRVPADKLEELAAELNEAPALQQFMVHHHRSAAWWIETKKKFDNYELDAVKLIRIIHKEMKEYGEEVEVAPATVAPKKEKQVIRPEEALTETVAKISVVGESVEVVFRENRKDFNQIVRDKGFVWCDGYWSRALKKRNGSVTDRAAEIVHRILAAGFIVSADDEILEKGMAADYAPEVTSWVSVTREEHPDYPGWFYILWDKKDDFYKAAKLIKGSRYLKPGVVVPPRMFAEVQDFAEMHGFNFTGPAKRLVDGAEAAKATELRVSVPPVNDDPIIADGRPKTLPVPEAVEVDASLRDDN